MWSNTMPGRPASIVIGVHDWGTADVIVNGWKNDIWRTCVGVELMAAMPIMPLAKLASVAVAVAVTPPGPTALHEIELPVAVAVSVYATLAAGL
jgi:hypothetical protein